MTKQWHPIFARFLRETLQTYYELQTNVPVGDTPRQADIVLLRRLITGPIPFQGLWRYLTPWSILEYKGPTVSARVGDLDLLLEVGLGIHRRLNEERRRQGQRQIPREDVSFWYLANRLGERFRTNLDSLLGPVEQLGPGLWRGVTWRHPFFLASGADLPVEPDSLPLHILVAGQKGGKRPVVEILAQRPALWQRYSAWLATLHPELWEEIRAMSKTQSSKFGFHFGPVIEEIGLKKVIDEVGLRRVIDEVGLKQVIDEVGLKQVIDEVGLSGLLSKMTPAQRRELKRLLEE